MWMAYEMMRLKSSKDSFPYFLRNSLRVGICIFPFWKRNYALRGLLGGGDRSLTFLVFPGSFKSSITTDYKQYLTI